MSLLRLLLRLSQDHRLVLYHTRALPCYSNELVISEELSAGKRNRPFGKGGRTYCHGIAERFNKADVHIMHVGMPLGRITVNIGTGIFWRNVDRSP